ANTQDKDMDLVAVDIGYGFVKAISQNTKKTVKFAAGVGHAVEDKTGDLFGKSTINQDASKNIHIEINSTEWFVGELAKRKSPEFLAPLDSQRHQDEITIHLLNVAIQLVSDSDNIYLVTGLPFEQYSSQKNKLKDAVLGNQPSVKWLSGENKNMRRQINIEQVIILPQAMSALFTVLFDDDGKSKRPDLMVEGTTIGLIDVGHKTTDYVYLAMEEGGQPVPIDDKSSTVEAGGVDVEHAITEKFTYETKETEISQRNLKKAYNSGKIRYSFANNETKNIDFTEKIKNTKKFVADKIFDRINNNWGSERNTLDEIYFVGGGSILYNAELQEKFGNRLKEIDNSQFANVKGYLWYGANVLASEQPQTKKAQDTQEY